MAGRKERISLGSLTSVKGRSRWRASDAREVLAAWRASGESLAAFTRRHDLSYYRIQSWRKRLSESSVPPTFHPVRVVDARSLSNGAESDPIAVVVRGGRRVVVGAGFDPSVLVRLVEALERC